METNIVYNEDCLVTMSHMEDSSVDLVVTSPPYDGLRKYNGYCFDFENVAKELYRVLKDGGVLVWVVGDQTKDGSETLTSFKQALYFVEVGFKMNDTMIWRKTNPMPQVKQPRYTQCFEYMFVLSKGKPKTFNPLMVPCKLADKVYDSTCKNMGGENGRIHKTFSINKEKVKENVWDIGIAQNKTKHPAVFPMELAKNHILSWSIEGDIVYDPFMGSGTTAIAARDLKRLWVGSEISEEYCKIIDERYNEKGDC